MKLVRMRRKLSKMIAKKTLRMHLNEDCHPLLRGGQIKAYGYNPALVNLLDTEAF